jgi:hypothetical protein
VIGVGARAAFGAGCFFATGGASLGAAAGAAAARPGAAAPARGGAADPGAPGSGVMMLTGGVDAADGKSIIVVGLPGGTLVTGDGGSAASAPDGTAAIAGMLAGAPQDPE